MVTLGKKQKQRRLRAKALRARAAATPWEKFSHYVGVRRTLLTLGFFALAMLIATTGEPPLRYSAGEKIRQPIIARVEFVVDDPEATQAAILRAKEQVPDVYRVSTAPVDRIISDVNNLFLAGQAAATFDAFKSDVSALGVTPDEALYETLQSASVTDKQQFSAAVSSLRARLMNERTIRLSDATGRKPPSTADFIRVEPQHEESKESTVEPPPTEINKFDLIQTASIHVEREAERLSNAFDRRVRPAVAQIIAHGLSAEPILVYDEVKTGDLVTKAQNITPKTKKISKGQDFVYPHWAEGSTEPVETGLTPADIDLLKKEDAAYQAFLESDHPDAVALRQQRRLERIGIAMVLLVLSISMFVYVGLYHPRVLEVPTRGLAFTGLMLLALLGVRFIDTRLPFNEFVVLPVLLVAAIMTIAYPRRFAAGVTVIFVIMVALLIRADLGITITLLVSGYCAALLLNNIRTRTKIIFAGLTAGAVVLFTTFAFRLIDRVGVEMALRPALIAAGSAVLAALLIQAGLPIIERVFKVATALTLLEWRDANRPLLQRLAREAPGTYNHSLVLGTMAEAACVDIGANGLLAHVGALYHDIGKIPKAEYFAENQEASINRHDNLAPSMSLLIILGHVKDGIEMAKEFGLPRVLIPFIAEHHGTTVVRYFHHMANEIQPQIASGRHDRQVSESEFRYPGPKPTSKETAILMLCDGVEGAVRSLHEPTAGRIESVVHQVLQARLKDGQFDNCDITLRELHLVEQSLVKSLCRFYHGRVAYPKDKESATAAGRPQSSADAPQRAKVAG